MSLSRIAALLGVVILMTAGQILFKLAAGRVGSPGLNWEFASRLLFNPYLIAGVVLYGVTTLLWVLVLVEGELSRSYPFVALTMVLVPLGGLWLFGESVTPTLLVGGVLILAGLAVISYG